jgi:hypothetical protein
MILGGYHASTFQVLRKKNLNDKGDFAKWNVLQNMSDSLKWVFHFSNCFMISYAL